MRGLPARTRRRIVSGSLLGAGVVLAGILFIIVNYFGWKYYARWDWTSSGIYTVSEKTQGLLRQLDRDVEILVFLSPGEDLYGPVMELLSGYQSASERVAVRTIDPEKDLLEAQALVDRYQITQLNVLVFDSGDDRRVVNLADLADYDYSGMQYGDGAKMVAFKGEQVFSSTLLELIENRKPRIQFTSGHGEMTLDDMSTRGLSLARDLLGQDNFEMEEWVTLGAPTVPAGTDLIVIAGPTSNFIEPEIDLFRRYLDDDGRMLVLFDPTLAVDDRIVQTGLEPLLLDFGVQVSNDLVVDPTNPLPFFGPETIFVNVYGSHRITKALDQAQLPVIIPLGRSVRAGEPIEGLRVTELMMTSAEGWGETDLLNLKQVDKQEADIPGPVSLAVAVESVVEGRATESEADDGQPGPQSDPDGLEGLRMVVIGDSDFASNSQMQNVPNATFLANTFNWLVERETLIGIPPKAPEQVRLSLTRGELSRISWMVLGGLPGLALALGGVVYMRRRR